MKNIWEKYYDWILASVGLVFTAILGWLVIGSIFDISSSLDRAFRNPDSNAVRVQFDFKGLESLGLTANAPAVIVTSTTATSTGEVGEEETQ